MRTRLDNAVARLGELFPRRVVVPLVRAALGDDRVALCLHRVGKRRSTDWQPFLCIEAERLDDLIELLLSTRGPTPGRWLTVSFDDGYEDAASYVASRAARFPMIEFMLFVCPQKTLLRAGFRWDLSELRLCDRRADAFETGPLDVETENHRSDLRALCERPEFRLAGVELLKRLQVHPNVVLGNHTDCHFVPAELSEDQIRRDYGRSLKTFTQLLGPTDQFAFPYGAPEGHFDARHVSWVRQLGDFLMWTTEPRPYARGDRRPGAVLPRYAPNGRWNPCGIAFWIAARAVHARFFKAVGDYPVPVPVAVREAPGPN